MKDYAFRREAIDGLRAILPLIVAAAPIGFVFGAVATGNGLSPLETVLMSALGLVFGTADLKIAAGVDTGTPSDRPDGRPLRPARAAGASSESTDCRPDG